MRDEVGLPAEHRTAVVFRRARPFARDVTVQRWPLGQEFQLPRLVVEALNRGKLLFAAERCLLDGGLHDANSLVIDADRHWEWLPVLAAVGEREPRRIAEAIGRAMHHLGNHGE